jgi:Spy/CpxP family protein refolding chaperone
MAGKMLCLPKNVSSILYSCIIYQSKFHTTKNTNMKKLFTAAAFLLLCGFTSVMAQPPGGGGRGMDPATMKERAKERIKPQLIEKVKLTDAQADKVVDIYVDAQIESSKIRRDEALSQEDKDKKSKEINAGRDKKLKEIPLTDDQLKAVATFYEELRNQRMQGGGGNRPAGGGGN